MHVKIAGSSWSVSPGMTCSLNSWKVSGTALVNLSNLKMELCLSLMRGMGRTVV